MGEKNKPNELYITRIYDAPVKMVWDAWVDPDQVAKWWGPRGFTITTHKKDVRVHGVWEYTMHGPDGVNYENKTKFLEVEKYSRLVYDHGGNDERPPLFRVQVDFSEDKGKTKMEMTMILPTPEDAKKTKKFIKEAGGDTTWDRLAEYLSDHDQFFINRSFDAPIELIFEMWTNPKHLSQWLPPQGFTMTCIKADIKKGGFNFYCMENGEGAKLYGKNHYQEIIKPHSIIYTQIFCDENEKMSRHPIAPTWPSTMLVTIALAEEGKNKTRVTMTMEVHGEATAAERETFQVAKGGMTQGCSQSFDKLEKYLPAYL